MRYYFEKVSPMHPDKIADRIAGALIDWAYMEDEGAICSIDVLIGHGVCNILSESNIAFDEDFVLKKVEEIAQVKDIKLNIKNVGQDAILKKNQQKVTVCGDNGIFKGVPTSKIEQDFTDLMARLYKKFHSDAKGIIYYNDGRGEEGYDATYTYQNMKTFNLTICQSNAKDKEIEKIVNYWLEEKSINPKIVKTIINPLGMWTGGLDVDAGATNRKLGSDMGRAITGGGLHGKDLTKADVTLNLLAYDLAQETGEDVSFHCNIGDYCIYPYNKGEELFSKISCKYSIAEGFPYNDIAEEYRARTNFEELAEWGLIKPKKFIFEKEY